MKLKAALFLIVVACGGKSKPADPAPDHTTPMTTETAKEVPPDTAKPAEPGTGALAPVDNSGLQAQVALAEQYEVGKKVYTEKKCATCHGDNGEGNPKNPPVIGEKAYPEQPLATAKLRKGITFKTAKDVLDFIKAKMPIKSPGTLTDDEAAAVASWMLSESKVNITAKLDASNAATVNLR